MLTFLFNLPQQPVSSSTAYDDYMLRMAGYIGYGYDADEWTTAQTNELDRFVNEAWEYVKYPSTIPGERIPHVWSWLESIETLTTEADEYEYSLESDFGSICGDFTFAAGTTSYSPVKQTSEQIIRTKRQYSNRTGRPECFALKWGAQTRALSQFRTVQFYPTPDGAYVLTYKYAVLAGKLSSDNPYPLGGPRTGQLMIEACKAVGEAAKYGKRGDQWNIFIDRLQAAIQMDKGTNMAPTVGMMAGAHSGPVSGPIVSNVSYYFGPDSSGTYTLEA